MWNEVLKTVLTVVIGALLTLGLKALGIEIDPVLFNTIVAGIVLWILTQLGIEVAARIAPRYFYGNRW